MNLPRRQCWQSGRARSDLRPSAEGVPHGPAWVVLHRRPGVGWHVWLPPHVVEVIVLVHLPTRRQRCLAHRSWPGCTLGLHPLRLGASYCRRQPLDPLRSRCGLSHATKIEAARRPWGMPLGRGYLVLAIIPAAGHLHRHRRHRIVRGQVLPACCRHPPVPLPWRLLILKPNAGHGRRWRWPVQVLGHPRRPWQRYQPVRCRPMRARPGGQLGGWRHWSGDRPGRRELVAVVLRSEGLPGLRVRRAVTFWLAREKHEKSGSAPASTRQQCGSASAATHRSPWLHPIEVRVAKVPPHWAR